MDANLSKVARLTARQHGIADLTYEPVWKFFEALHIMLSITVMVMNVMSLWVIYRVVLKVTVPMQILSNTAIVSLLAPWCVLIMYMPPNACQWEIESGIQLTTHNAFGFTLVFLASSHLIATYMPIKYETLLKKRCIWITLNAFWMVAIITGHSHFFTALITPDYHLTFCEDVFQHTKIATLISISICVAVTVFNLVMYLLILLIIQPLAGSQGHSPPKSRRGITTGLVLISTFLLSWLPFLVLKHIETSSGKTQSEKLLIGQAITLSAILLNFIAVPIIYGMRMVNVFTAYKMFFRNIKDYFIAVWQRLRHKEESDPGASTPLEPIESIC